jgi:hypothetical protein
MAVSSAGLRPKSDCSSKAQKQLHSKLQTPLVREGATKYQSRKSKGNFKEKEKLVTGPRWAPDNKTDWPTDYRSLINFNFITRPGHTLQAHSCHLKCIL